MHSRICHDVIITLTANTATTQGLKFRAELESSNGDAFVSHFRVVAEAHCEARRDGESPLQSL